MMGIMQTQKVEKDLDSPLQNDPFVRPKGDISLINDLPPELLSRIFEVGVSDNDSEDEDDIGEYWDSDMVGGKEGVREEIDIDDDDDDDDNSDSDSNSNSTGSSGFASPWPPFQIIVSHVCRHWRNVALSTPSLWTTITVTPEDGPPYQRVSSLLGRSKGLPVDIYVSCETEDRCGALPICGVPDDEDLASLYNLLTSHIHRWRSIEVSVSEYRHMFKFLSAVSDLPISAAPQLTTLQLYHHEDTEEFEDFGYPSMSKRFILFGGSAPCLTGVVLWGVHVDWNQPWISSASKLVDLELAFHTEDVRPSWTQLAAILHGASSLQKLSLRMSGPSGDPPEWIIEPTPGGSSDLNALVQLPRVTDFILAFHSQPRAIGLLRKFFLPALKNLGLDFDNGDYTELVDVLAGPPTSLPLLATQEQPRSLLISLESLKLAGFPCRTDCVEKLYGELQNLTSLNISLSYLDQQFLVILGTSCTLAGHGDIWLPSLETLYVSGTSGNALREVVEKRKDAGLPLKSLYVEESCELDKEDAHWLHENVETFELFQGSDDEDVVEFEDSHEDADEWSDMD